MRMLPLASLTLCKDPVGKCGSLALPNSHIGQLLFEAANRSSSSGKNFSPSGNLGITLDQNRVEAFQQAAAEESQACVLLEVPRPSPWMLRPSLAGRLES